MNHSYPTEKIPNDYYNEGLKEEVPVDDFPKPHDHYVKQEFDSKRNLESDQIQIGAPQTRSDHMADSEWNAWRMQWSQYYMEMGQYYISLGQFYYMQQAHNKQMQDVNQQLHHMQIGDPETESDHYKVDLESKL